MTSRNPTNYKDRHRDSGISWPSLLMGMQPQHCLGIPAGLCDDTMHVTTFNIGDLLLPLWRGTFECEPTDTVDSWPWAVLTGQTWINHGLAVENAHPFIPGCFDRPPRNIALKIKSGYKAKEWQGYLYGLAPALLYGILPLDIWQNFCQMVVAVRIFLQQSISKEDIILAQKHIDLFHCNFKLLYLQRRSDRLHFHRPSLHALIHLSLEVHQLGPPCLHSTWTMERTIGNLG
jgi:hypothetical protein